MDGSSAKDLGAVFKCGVASRLSLFLFQVFTHCVIPDHTGSMEDVFMKGYRHPPHHPVIEATLGGFDNWDSEHFIFIAENGYDVHEQTMAFFPLFPSLLWLLSNSLFWPLTLFLPMRSVLLISGFILNLTLFPFAALSLYLLTQNVFRDRHLSLLTAALFCINPASVFMSALYTECLFAFFTFSGLLALERDRSWIATLLFMFAVATRSNGIVLCGYIGYRCLRETFRMVTTHSFSASIMELPARIATACLQCVAIVFPLALFQYYGYQLYCTSGGQGSHPEWCSWSLPLPYTFIQEHYWNNGFLRYFQLKQIPNFLLATPMIVLASTCVMSYFTGYSGARNRHREKTSYSQLESDHMRPYIIHLGFLLLFGTFFMNVQVITRFICSSSPVIYWFSANILLSTLRSVKAVSLLQPKQFTVGKVASELLSTVYREAGVTGSKLVLSYFLLYLTVGVVLHCNFYPWT